MWATKCDEFVWHNPAAITVFYLLQSHNNKTQHFQLTENAEKNIIITSAEHEQCHGLDK